MTELDLRGSNGKGSCLASAAPRTAKLRARIARPAATAVSARSWCEALANRIIPVIVIFGFVILADPGTAHGDEGGSGIDQDALHRIEMHLAQIYRANSGQKDLKILKWNTPIRYFYGMFAYPADRAFFEYTMRYLGELTGLSVEKADSPTGHMDIVIVFTTEFLKQMNEALFKKVFKGRNESDVAYEARMRSVEPGGGSMAQTSITDETVQYFVAVMNCSDMSISDIRGFVMRVLFSAFSFADGRSDVFQPSVSNHGVLHNPGRLPSIDEAVLRALYSPEIRHHMPLGEALPLMALHIYKDLY